LRFGQRIERWQNLGGTLSEADNTHFEFSQDSETYGKDEAHPVRYSLVL
jgi:hypothetical protein